uniref:Transthyretin-like protein 5 n=1 Tax=Parastrongyloides trichosuri TaxID=131310 RepID=A0A0N4Z135_PARTI
MIFTLRNFLFFLFIISYYHVSPIQQTVAVRGRLMCGDEPLANDKVRLWDDSTLSTDTQLASVRTNSSGYYELKGSKGATFTMDVKLKFYTDCEDGIMPCQRKITLTIPSKYITKGDNEVKWFDAGTMNLALKFKDEDRDC